MNGVDESGNRRLSMSKVRILPRKAMNRVALRRRVPSERLKKGVYLLPSLFTTGNLICGFFSLISTFNGQYLQAAVFIIIAHLLDGVDGSVARLTRATSQFGVEFDSLADLVSFGVAPAALVYFWALVPWQTWGWLAACLYVVCGALRLARFNVQMRTENRGKNPLCRLADTGGGGNDRGNRPDVLLSGGRGSGEQTHHFTAGHLLPGGAHGQQLQLFQPEATRSQEAAPFLALAFRHPYY
jgi:CDP-diacylglycerol--serine O-phosphatidyltransferase